MDFFRLNDDDMLPYWTASSVFAFSEELNSWFVSLKKDFDEIVDNYHEPFLSFKNIMELLKRAHHFRQIYVFEDFLYATLESLSDKYYQSVWKLFERILQEMEGHNGEEIKSDRIVLKRFLTLCANQELSSKALRF